MKIHDCIQGTQEWLLLRSGIPTASNFDKIVTPGGKLSKSQEPYMFKLLAERLMGHPCEEFMSMWMQRGNAEEARAVQFYELQCDLDTTPIGFITNDAGTIGASPDRLVGDPGLLEIKVPKEATHMSYLLRSGSAYEEYRVQVQGQLWVTGREWSDVLSWHPELPPALLRIVRDEPFIMILSAAVEAFSTALETQWKLCEDRGWTKAKPKKPAMSEQEILLAALRESLIEVNSARDAPQVPEGREL